MNTLQHFLSLKDLTQEQLLGLLALAKKVKACPQDYNQALAGKSIVTLYEKQSLRTRVTFDIGIAKLGGHSVYLDQKQSDKLGHYCIDNGINFFDTGPLYGNGNSEKILGEIIKDKRKDLLISTKAGLEKEIRQDGSFGVKVKKLTPKYIKNSLEKSL